MCVFSFLYTNLSFTTINTLVDIYSVYIYKLYIILFIYIILLDIIGYPIYSFFLINSIGFYGLLLGHLTDFIVDFMS